MTELGISGVSIAILNSGKIEWAKGYGMADIAENRMHFTNKRIINDVFKLMYEIKKNRRCIYLKDIQRITDKFIVKAQDMDLLRAKLQGMNTQPITQIASN